MTTRTCTVSWIDSIGHGEPGPHRCESDHRFQLHIHSCSCGTAVDDLGRVLSRTPTQPRAVIADHPPLAPVPQLVADFLMGRVVLSHLNPDQQRALTVACHLASDVLPDHVLTGGAL